MTTDDRPSPHGEAPPGGDGEVEDELAAVLDAYLAEVEAGRPVDPEDWVRRHPSIAGRLRACLRGLHLVEAAAEGLDITPGPPGGAADPDVARIGDFRIVHELGRGGMGVVYEAVEGSLGRRVALKVLPLAAAIDPRRIARFRVEAQAASQLDHPHIVPVYSVGCQGGVHYYAMRLIDGPTIARVIAELRRQDGDGRAAAEIKPTPTVPVAAGQDDEVDAGRGSPDALRDRTADRPSRCCEPPRESRLRAGSEDPGRLKPGCQPGPPSRPAAASGWSMGSNSARDRSFFREAARLGRAAAEALEHAHRQGVLHRDIKPSNLMVDARGHLFVTDFGLARFRGDASLTAPGDLLGTLRYMSPEQATADHAVIDERTDVYSLGATLYELVTLRPAFDGTDRPALLRRIAAEEPRRPRAIRPAVPRDLETILLKAMAKDPAARYATAQELADDLGRFLDDRPIRARRPGPLERAARWARRHAAALIIAVPLLAAIALALGLAVAIVTADRARIRAQRAEIERAHLDVSRQRDAARRQRDAARLAVDEMYTQVADTWLGRQPSLQPLQRAFLLKALAYYREFAAERDTDPAVRARAGEAAFRVGEIQRALGRRDEAERAYRRAIAVLGSTPDDSADGRILEPLGRSYGGLGQLLADSDRTAEARPVLDRAIELTRRLVSRLPDAPAGRSRLAAAQHRLGLWLRLAGRDAEAEAAYRRAIELAGAMGGPIGRAMQAGVHGNLGALLSLTGRRDEAERAFREAVALYEPLVRGEPEVPVYRQELARALDRLGVLAAKRPGGRPEAERLIRRALELFDRLAAESPGVPSFRQDLALALLDLADVLAADGHPREAEPFAARSVALFEELIGGSPPGPAMVRRQLVGALDRLADWLPAAGRPADAEPSLRRAIELREALAAEGAGEPADRAATATARARLGALLAARGDRAEARRALEKAAADEPAATAAATHLSRCAALAERDETLSSEARARAVRDYAVRAREALRRAVEAGDDPAAPYFLAWFLTAGPLAELRDPPEAIRIAHGIIDRAPGSWVAWATLGAAHYRDDSPRDAVVALEHAAALHRGDLMHYGFFLAMAYHRLEEADRARDSFDRADRRLHGVRDEEILRIRAEAAALLGLADTGRGMVGDKYEGAADGPR